MIFTNSVKFNGLHLESDTTGSSKHYHDVAVEFASKLKNLIDEDFSIDVADKIIRAQLSHEEDLHKKLDMGIEVDLTVTRKIKDTTKNQSNLLDYVTGKDMDSDEEKPRFDSDDDGDEYKLEKDVGDDDDLPDDVDDEDDDDPYANEDLDDNEAYRGKVAEVAVVVVVEAVEVREDRESGVVTVSYEVGRRAQSRVAHMRMGMRCMTKMMSQKRILILVMQSRTKLMRQK